MGRDSPGFLPDAASKSYLNRWDVRGTAQPPRHGSRADKAERVALGSLVARARAHESHRLTVISETISRKSGLDLKLTRLLTP
jgi:hypothetical protein